MLIVEACEESAESFEFRIGQWLWLHFCGSRHFRRSRITEKTRCSSPGASDFYAEQGSYQGAAGTDWGGLVKFLFSIAPRRGNLIAIVIALGAARG